MDETDGIRLRRSSEDVVSLASYLNETINQEDNHFSALRSDLETDAYNLEAETWSMTVGQAYLKGLNKEAIKRQDVIYELIQTEMHHVRTLKILIYVYMHALKETLLMEDERLERLFPAVDVLLPLHQHFLNSLKLCRNQSQEDENPNICQITYLSDVLVSQFSGDLGERMKLWYTIFCSRQSEALCHYKEQLQSNKKFQSLVKKIAQLPLVRRLGIPECFLLVTQRITKYPVLVERVLQNTDAGTEEYQCLAQALTLIKETISKVNAQVSEYKKIIRLREIGTRLEPKSQARLRNGHLFRREDLIQGNKTLLHEGDVAMKANSGRSKDIHAVLLSDVLLLLQEKDQKLVFATVDNKPPVISLQKLIVREVANEDKAMFLICAQTSSMYEIHTGSREERNTWMNFIWEAVNSYSEEEDQPQDEQTAKLKEFQACLLTKDVHIVQSLTEKLQIFAALSETVTKQESPYKRLLLRGDAMDLQQGETLLKGAIDDVEILQSLLLSRIRDPNMLVDESQLQEVMDSDDENYGTVDSNSAAKTMKNGDPSEGNGDDSSDQPYHKSLEQSDADATPVSYSSRFPEEEVFDRVLSLGQRLYSLQAIIAQQDSQIELQRTLLSKSKQPTHHSSNMLLEQEKQRNLEKQKAELASFHKLKAQHQDEQERWEKEKERQKVQNETLETQLLQREEECRRWEAKLQDEKAELEKQRKVYQEDLERLRETTKHVEREKERLEQQQEKFKKHMSIANPGHLSHNDPSQYLNLASNCFQSFRGGVGNGVGNQAKINTKSHTMSGIPSGSNPTDVPPKVPPRKESILNLQPKAEVPIHLISTSNQVYKPPSVQQQIPTKLAVLPKGKEKSKSHQRTKSADVFSSPGSAQNVKTTHSFNRQKDNEKTPPEPPPFPKDVLKTDKEKVIFL
ncbi:rho guanine nucleotide exchange factor 18a isoform X2 [Thalassophryne amazonica]|uniref:rho guanine nucleotide exchange factor 18a isoform X2 n=1 Tax=Thalassophryne amazonica TaxID=390379 RepID=UPI001470EB18|nr:rho guanine nucleotide exchange factor 18a isoform X2 [Thalassophryne amazonica]